MNDIYEHKAKKYKYKYLKLKKELEGGVLTFLKSKFNTKKTIKENTVKILEKAIQDVTDKIAPLFSNSSFLGRIYTKKGYLPKKKTHWSDSYHVNSTDINQYIYERELTKKEYPSTLYWYYYFKYQANITKKAFNESDFIFKLDPNYQTKYNELPEKDRIYNLIEPIARTLDIYLIIMFIKELFYYRVYSIFDNDTINLVQKVENDAYENNIGSPDLLIEKIQEIIKSINDSIPTTPIKK